MTGNNVDDTSKTTVSNCWQFAHDQFNEADGKLWICFRLSAFSKWKGKVPKPIKKLFRFFIGILYRALNYVSIFAYEGWLHCVVRKDMPDGYREFVSIEKKRRLWFPPTKYEGKVVDN